MKLIYSMPIAKIFSIESDFVICQSAGLDSFVGPSDPTDPTDPYNYPW